MDACYTTQQALTRPRNDPFHQVDDMRITSYASRYYLNRPATNCPTTFPVNATTRIQASGASWPQGKWKTDVESDLKGISRLGTKIRCDAVQYNPDNNQINQTGLEHAQDENIPLTFDWPLIKKKSRREFIILFYKSKNKYIIV